MKKTLLTFFALSCFLHQALAVEHVITFPGFAYNPAEITVEVGDIITWNGNFGTHPLESVNVPAGAQSFFNNTGTTFSYTIEVPGNYTYHCTIHSVMTGIIMANASVNIAEANTDLAQDFVLTNMGDRLLLQQPSDLQQSITTLSIFSTDGKLIASRALAANQPEQWIELPEAMSGITVVSLQNGSRKKTWKLQ